MSKHIFILGAGASVQGGAPLMNNFLDVAQSVLVNKHCDGDEQHFENVFKARSELQRTHSKSKTVDLYNMEAVFSAFEMGRLLGQLGPYTQEELNSLAYSYRKVIGKTLEESVEYPVENKQVSPPKPYNKYIELVSHILDKTKDHATTLTFNYDVGVDYAFHKKHMDCGRKTGVLVA